jgi:hypothetical protein
MSMGDSPPSIPPASTPVAEVPPDAAQAAAARGFGALLGARINNRPMVTALVYFVLSAVCLVMLLVTSWLIGEVFHPASGSLVWSVLRIVPLAFCFGFVILPVYAIKALVAGSRSLFAYPNGLVYKHNKEIQAVAWPEVTELKSVVGTRGEQAGKLLYYNLVPAAGKPIPLPINVVDGKDEFLDHVIEGLRRYQRPIN